MEWNIGMTMDVIMAVCFLVAVIRGWNIGLAMKIGQFIVLVVSFVVAKLVSGVFASVLGKQWILPYLEERTNTELASIPFVEKGIDVASKMIAGHILFLVIFFIAMIILNQFIGILHIVDYIPVVNILNCIGGVVVSFLICFLVFFIIIGVLCSVLPQSLFDHIGLTKKVMEDTYILKTFVP